MKLRSLFECFKCFMIGDYKETNSGIENHLYPQDKPFDVYHRDAEASSAPLYTPPSDETDGDTIVNNGVSDSAHSHEDDEVTSVNMFNEQGFNANPDIFKCMSDIVVELDMVKQKITNDETMQMITFCQDKIIEGLSSSGAQLIDNDESYSNARHYPIPYGIYPEGIPIKRIIRPGVVIQKDIVLKALVEL